MAVGRGGKRGMRPGQHCVGGGIWRGENMEFWNLAPSGEFTFALQTVIFLHTLTHNNTLPLVGPYLLTVSAPPPHKKQCVHQETYTADLTDHSPDVKLYRRSILSNYCFIDNHNSVFCTIHVSKFCIKFGTSAWNFVIWFPGKSLNLLQPDFRFYS